MRSDHDTGRQSLLEKYWRRHAGSAKNTEIETPNNNGVSNESKPRQDVQPVCQEHSPLVFCAGLLQDHEGFLLHARHPICFHIGLRRVSDGANGQSQQEGVHWKTTSGEIGGAEKPIV